MSYIVAFIALCSVILVHEFGHYIVAIFTGVHVIEFSIGMGPRLLSKKVGDTTYSIKALPLGGSCEMLGEVDIKDSDKDESEKAEKYKELAEKYKGHAMNDISIPKRIAILLAGPGMNILTSAIMFGIYGYVASGYRLKGLILLKYVCAMEWEITKLIIMAIGMMFTGKAGLNDLAGPIGTVAELGKMIDGLLMTASSVGLLNISIGLMNLIPLPILDGGQATFAFFELVTKKKINKTFKTILMVLTVLFFIGLAIVISIHDIFRIVSGG